jgi:predicted glycoside hydrolase/deacetylase ChbG (UPF0249 family)
MSLSRRLIVNADDFGLSRGVNRGIIRAHEQGIVTSASLMVRAPEAEAAAAYAGSHPGLSVGLHIDLCEWVFVDEAWRPVYEVVPVGDSAAIAGEVARQLEAFRELMGCDPSHLDSHQHVHRSEPVLSVVSRAAEQLGVLLRGADSAVVYCGDFYGQSYKGDAYPQGITVDALIEILRKLGPGTTELGCHPGDGNEVNSTYCRERGVECATLCDSRIGDTIRQEDIRLCSFRDFKAE